ncbi:hypothetical protein CNR22_20665 [Sphingobacteriaceae bacterium]|nr:hypothetical protein CNR22_20665 [Sphingobacteriaceae bacterium]
MSSSTAVKLGLYNMIKKPLVTISDILFNASGFAEKDGSIKTLMDLRLRRLIITFNFKLLK